MLSTAKKLYDTDFNLWVEETANLLKEGKWEYLDLENLIEEIEAMGRSDKKALKSNLEKLLLHPVISHYNLFSRKNRQHKLLYFRAFSSITRL